MICSLISSALLTSIFFILISKESLYKSCFETLITPNLTEKWTHEMRMNSLMKSWAFSLALKTVYLMFCKM